MVVQLVTTSVSWGRSHLQSHLNCYLNLPNLPCCYCWSKLRQFEPRALPAVTWPVALVVIALPWAVAALVRQVIAQLVTGQATVKAFAAGQPSLIVKQVTEQLAIAVEALPVAELRAPWVAKLATVAWARVVVIATSQLVVVATQLIVEPVIVVKRIKGVFVCG